MAQLEFGLRQGLAVPLVRDRTQEIYQAYTMKKQAEHEAEIKAKMFADDFDFQNVNNAYDNPRIKEYAAKRIGEIGTFIRENPDWERNVGKRAQYKMMIHDLKDNPELNRGLHSNASYKEMADSFTKNPELAASPEGLQWQQKWKNYEKFGHQDGEEGLKRDGGPKEFKFVPIELFDDEKYIEERFSKLPTRDRVLTSKEWGAQVGAGATISDVDINRARTEALSIIKDPAVGYKYQALWKQMNDSDKSFYGNNVVDWIANRGISHTTKKANTGQYHFSDGNSSGGKGETYSPFFNDLGNSKPNSINFTKSVDAISPIKEGRLSTAAPLRVMTKDVNGNVNWIHLSSYQGLDLEARNTGRTFTGPKNELMVEVKLNAPITQELVNGNTPLLNDNSHFFESYNADEANDTAENPAYLQVARLQKDKDGKATGNVELTAFIPAITEPSNIRNYDNMESGQANANRNEGVAINKINNRNATYQHYATNPTTGQRIASNDGVNWFSVK